MFFFHVFQGEIDAHEDSFRATDEAGQGLLNTGHYASEEVKEKVGLAGTAYFASSMRCYYIYNTSAPF